MICQNNSIQAKKVVFLSILITFFTFSCQNEEKPDSTYQEVEILGEDDYIEEEGYEDFGMEENILVLEAYLDGPDEWFYTDLPEDSDVNLDYFEYDLIQIIPNIYSEESGFNTKAQTFMVAHAENNFKLYEPYNVGTKTVEVFYDRSKTLKMISYTIIDGLADGLCTVYDPNGDIYIERNYKMGKWISSTTEPFSVDWEFHQDDSYLNIYDTQRAMTTENGVDVIKIMPSKNEGEDNSLYKIIQKASFKNPFTINEVDFTGILRGYNHPKRINEERLYYELNFTDGWLDGDIKIYNDWGDLELHEVFVMGDLDTTIFMSEYEDGVAKPIIYFYPEKDMFVDVKLNFDGRLTHTYPLYHNGWQVYAKTDGTLYDKSKQEYYALYWEGQANQEFKFDEGFVVEGKNTISFLEESLAILGLNRKEANEFIIYWLPQMENNPYNLIHFSSTQYQDMAELTITPKPETLIRVMMVFQPLDSKIDFPEQDLTQLSVQRKGFTVVEWGGKKISKSVQIEL